MKWLSSSLVQGGFAVASMALAGAIVVAMLDRTKVSMLGEQTPQGAVAFVQSANLLFDPQTSPFRLLLKGRSFHGSMRVIRLPSLHESSSGILGKFLSDQRIVQNEDTLMIARREFADRFVVLLDLDGAGTIGEVWLPTLGAFNFEAPNGTRAPAAVTRSYPRAVTKVPWQQPLPSNTRLYWARLDSRPTALWVNMTSRLVVNPENKMMYRLVPNPNGRFLLASQRFELSSCPPCP
jgi:hypothetical protein